MAIRWRKEGLYALGLCIAFVVGCGDSSEGDMAGMTATGGTGGSGGSGGSGGTGGSGGGPAATCINPGEPRPECKDQLPPMAGECAPKGECCHRDSATARLEAQADPNAPAVFEYRLVYSSVQNHPGSLGQTLLQDLAASRAAICSGEQCLLWRFTEPRMDGMRVDGPGTAQFGIGRYNCDGTYSYYGDNVAPTREGHTDPGRWAGVEVPTTVVTAIHDRDHAQIAFSDNANREVTCSPFVDGNYELDWELCSSGFDILSMDNAPGMEDCKGSYDGVDYTPGGQYQVFAPLEANRADGINDLTGMSFCQLMSFGIVSDPPDCIDEPRCMPDGNGPCPWIKLPDGLCPTNADERALFGCHLGDVDNVNGEANYPTVSCTAEAPTTPRDPDAGATDEGQCCDPLGMDDSLPACNAFRIINDYVAASVQITDETEDELGPECSMM